MYGVLRRVPDTSWRLLVINGKGEVLIYNCNVACRNIKRVHSITEDLCTVKDLRKVEVKEEET